METGPTREQNMLCLFSSWKLVQLEKRHTMFQNHWIFDLLFFAFYLFTYILVIVNCFFFFFTWLVCCYLEEMWTLKSLSLPECRRFSMNLQ